MGTKCESANCNLRQSVNRGSALGETGGTDSDQKRKCQNGVLWDEWILINGEELEGFADRG